MSDKIALEGLPHNLELNQLEDLMIIYGVVGDMINKLNDVAGGSGHYGATNLEIRTKARDAALALAKLASALNSRRIQIRSKIND